MRLTDALWTPATWDAAINTDAWENVLATIQSGAPDDEALRLLAILASRDAARIQAQLDLMQGMHGRIVRGARMIALVDLGRYTEVFGMRDESLPLGAGLPDLFDAGNAAFAVGMAAGMLGHEVSSCGHLMSARGLARALGMTFREQHVAVELEAARTALGDPSPIRIRQAMAMAPMTARRAHRAGAALAEAYMALGDYRAAQLAAPADGDLRAFVDVLLGDEPRELPLDAGDYVPLAQAMQGRPVRLPGLTGGPEAMYETLVRGHLLTRTPSTASQASAVLAARRPRTPDARVYWGSLMWASLAEGASGGVHPSVMVEEIHTGLRDLTVVDDVASVFLRYSPHLYVLLAFMPDAHPAFTARLMDIPLLVGNLVMYQGQAFKMPGKVGCGMVTDMALGRRERKMHPQERSRFFSDLGELQLPMEPVNLGWAVRAFATVARSMVGVERDRWNTHGLSMCQGLNGPEAVESCRKLFAE